MSNSARNQVWHLEITEGSKYHRDEGGRGVFIFPTLPLKALGEKWESGHLIKKITWYDWKLLSAADFKLKNELRNSNLNSVFSPKNNRYKDFTLCSFVCTYSLCVWDFPITAQRHAALMKWRLPPSSPNSVRNLVKASQWYFSVVSLSYQLRVLFYQIFRRSCRHLQSSQTQQKVTERELSDFVVMWGFHHCRDSVSPGLSRCNLA